MAYIIQIIFILFSAFLLLSSDFDDDTIKKNNNNTFLIIVFGMLAFMMAFRSNTVGVDTVSYERWFYTINNYSFKEVIANQDGSGFEFGWRMLYKISGCLFKNYYFFQFVYSIIYFCLEVNFLKRWSNNVLLTLLVFIGIGFYTGAYNGQRQFLAIMLVVNGFTYLTQKDYEKAMPFFFIAPMIHTTSIVFLLGIVIYVISKNKFLFKFVPLVLIAIAINYQKIIEISEKLFPHYANYYNNHKALNQAKGVWIIWIIIISISIYSIYISKAKDRETNTFAAFSLIYVICNIVGLYFNYFQRLGWYFGPFIPLLFDKFAYTFKSDGLLCKFYYIGVISAFSAYYILSGFTERAIEYSFFFDK